MGFTFEKLPYPRDSNQLPAVFIAGELITNTNNYTNIHKKSKSYLDMPIGNRRSCYEKKTCDKKYRDTLLFKYEYFTPCVL
jgi:hypothetical protein